MVKELNKKIKKKIVRMTPGNNVFYIIFLSNFVYHYFIIIIYFFNNTQGTTYIKNILIIK